MVLFGQIVIGPPGAGKTTFCNGMKLFLEAIGRNCIIVNLDFANDATPYEAAIDVRDLISMEEVMDTLELGPNGSLVYCMEYLLEHASWLIDRIEDKMKSQAGAVDGEGRSGETNYLIFDCPGQVELFTHYTCVQDLIHEHLVKRLDLRLTCVHLVDSVACCNVSTFLSAALLVTSTMYRIALPHVSVLTKVDLLATAYKDSVPFSIDFYTQCTNFLPLVRFVDAHVDNTAFSEGVGESDLEDEDDDDNEGGAQAEVDADGRAAADRGAGRAPKGNGKPAAYSSKLFAKHRKMTEGLCELLNDYEMVSFLPCSIEDKESVARILTSIDKGNGYSLAVVEASQYLSNNAPGGGGNHAGGTMGRGGGGSSASAAGVSYTHTAVDQEVEESYYRSGLQVVEKYEAMEELRKREEAEAQAQVQVQATKQPK